MNLKKIKDSRALREEIQDFLKAANKRGKSAVDLSNGWKIMLFIDKGFNNWDLSMHLVPPSGERKILKDKGKGTNPRIPTIETILSEMGVSKMQDSSTDIPFWARRGLWGARVEKFGNIKILKIGHVLLGIITYSSGRVSVKLPLPSHMSKYESYYKTVQGVTGSVNGTYNSWSEIYLALDKALGRAKVAEIYCQYPISNPAIAKGSNRVSFKCHFKNGFMSVDTEGYEVDDITPVINEHWFNTLGLNFAIDDYSEDRGVVYYKPMVDGIEVPEE
jgi:hypothetical protein